MQFMRRNWQKKPLLVRQAIAGFKAPIARRRLFELAQGRDIESRLIEHVEGRWSSKSGPFNRRQVPPLTRPGWTLLVQGVDRHDEDAHRLVQQHFSFIPGARFDDLMVSFASEQGGVGPHLDRYDVFLLQACGHRRWRIGQPEGADSTLLPDLPLKILASFRPQLEYVLAPGDMLYLPPNWAHEGTAVGRDCMTYSIGFRAPTLQQLAVELLSRIADDAASMPNDALYRDPMQVAVSAPGAIPLSLRRFARQTITAALQEHGVVDRALGELLSEPHDSVWFEAQKPAAEPEALWPPLRLDRRSRMFYDNERIYLNGESRVTTGRDAQALQRLADLRMLDTSALRHCSAALRACLLEWLAAGWLHAGPEVEPQGDHR